MGQRSKPKLPAPLTASMFRATPSVRRRRVRKWPSGSTGCATANAIQLDGLHLDPYLHPVERGPEPPRLHGRHQYLPVFWTARSPILIRNNYVSGCGPRDAKRGWFYRIGNRDRWRHCGPGSRHSLRRYRLQSSGGLRYDWNRTGVWLATDRTWQHRRLGGNDAHGRSVCLSMGRHLHREITGINRPIGSNGCSYKTMWLASTAREAHGRTWCSGNLDLSQDYFRAKCRYTMGQLRWLTNSRSGWLGARSWERITLQSGRETLANQIAAERPGKGPSCALVRTLNLIGNPIWRAKSLSRASYRRLRASCRRDLRAPGTPQSQVAVELLLIP